MELNITQADCLDYAKSLPDNAINLTFGSPPYEAARTYGIDFKLRGQAWVDWMVERMVEFVRITDGLVAMVVEGQTRQFKWSATPALLMVDLHRRGICLRKPPAFKRVGIPGSGGPDWLRNDYEFIVCCTKGGKLPWSDNTAMGHPPKWAPGGEMANRLSNGARVNQFGRVGVERGIGGKMPETKNGDAMRRHTRGKGRNADGTTGSRPKAYGEPAVANPGNVIDIGAAGGGNMGDRLCHENEAPFPEKLAEFFIRSFCPPGGTVYDPFSGSGTTGKVAIQHGRQFMGTDIRESQVDLTKRRIGAAA
jgi:hypothetical protein